MTTLYGNPATGQVVAERPPCWGRSFNNEDPECRRCSYQNSCRDQIIRLSQSLNRQPAPVLQPPAPATVTPTSYFAQFQQVHPQAAPTLPVPYQPAPAPVPVATAPAAPQPVVVRHYAPPPAPPAPPKPPVQVATQPAVPPPPQMMDVYGRVQDPMYTMVTSAIPPFRPQMEGESFGMRVGKNMILVALEAVFGQIFLAVRQVFWPPTMPTVQKPPVSRDVTPGKQG